jgi:hypothetical protein
MHKHESQWRGGQVSVTAPPPQWLKNQNLKKGEIYQILILKIKITVVPWFWDALNRKMHRQLITCFREKIMYIIIGIVIIQTKNLFVLTNTKQYKTENLN